MNKNYGIPASLILLCSLCAASTNKDTIYITSSTPGNIQFTIHSQDIQNSTVTQSIQTMLYEKMGHHTTALQKVLHDIMGTINPQKIKITTYNWFMDNKLKLFGATALALYGAGFYTLYKAHTYLSQPLIWSSWHNELPFAQLLEIPQKDFATELVLEIQRRYTVANNPTDFITPLATFIEEINKEISTLNYYNLIYTWLKKYHLIKIFPLNKDQLETIGQRLERATYFKNVFLSWAAAYKLEHRSSLAQRLLAMEKR